MTFARRPSSGRPQRPVVKKSLHEPHEGVWKKELGIAAPITCAALAVNPSTPRFGVVPCTRKLDCSGMEPGQLERQYRFNLSSDDNRVCVW
ncbi:hypothetical protein TNCV_2228201 [Trichonephila clavipes]|nr:hypothetical protein TNCV_2228201 [Trichonephila clavipes]